MGLHLLDENIWQEITKRAKKSKRRHVAVAYLGREAHKLLPLGEGDSLVIDMSEGTVKAGLTDPSEVEKYWKTDVDVYNVSNLHAKVYVFDNTVIIGSANVSRNSQSNLVEACLLCEDRETATRARGFIKSLQVEPITPEYVKRCKKMYAPPKHGSAKRKRKNIIPLHQPLWLLSVTEDRNRSAEDDEHCKREEKEAKRKLEKNMSQPHCAGRRRIGSSKTPKRGTW